MPKVISLPAVKGLSIPEVQKLIAEYQAELEERYGCTFHASEIAEYLGCSRDAVYRALKRHRVPCVKLGGRQRIYRSVDVARMVAACTEVC